MFTWKSILVLFTTVAILFAAVPAFAHEDREVGDLEVEFGWEIEPALVGEINGAILFLFRGDTPVTDAEVEVTVIFGDQSATFPLEMKSEEPGVYLAPLIPTLPGDYTFRVTGTIGDMPIDETFTSADGFIDSVTPASDIQFPLAAPGTAELLQMIQDLQAQIDELRASIGS